MEYKVLLVYQLISGGYKNRLNNYDDDSIDYFRKADLQRQEAENVLKDLIYFCEKKAAS